MTLISAASAQIIEPSLDILGTLASNGWVHLNSTVYSNVLVNLEASIELRNWQTIGILHDGLHAYPDAAALAYPQRFYRLGVAPRGADDDWKNQILYPCEPFRSTNNPSEIQWVKFAILLSDPTRVYYQDSRKFPFHYDFLTQRLAPFRNLDRTSFDAISMRRANQQVVLGGVLYPPMAGYYPAGTVFTECGVQFAGLDPYTPEQIGRWFELVRATIFAADGAVFFYMPAFEQSEVVRTNSAAFAAQGIATASVERWVAGNSCYAAGWALGRLKFFSGTDIAAAFADGRLRPEEVLLTDGVPVETPLVAGIITLRPSTPNSHTAILSQSFGIPFAYVSEPGDQARVQALAGHQVLVRVTTDPVLVKVLDLETPLEPTLEAMLRALKQPAPIAITAKKRFGAWSASTDLLTPGDLCYFGGKAANYGLLRRSVPTNCPEAIAFSFDLWDAFLGQALPTGKTLRAEIATRLAPYTNYPPDIMALKADLAALRELITKGAQFTSVQQQAITNALTVFDPRRKIRFRSSTNVEDTEHFTGAGLYDSYSGCLLDDLDGDSSGPCHCDPSEANERGVFRAMQKVYASFYNDNAFLERLQHGVSENEVGMGLLVHPSFPDEDELANGVATLPFAPHGSRPVMTGGDLVTQLGAESVTNPQGNSIPEVVHGWGDAFASDVTLRQRSSRVPLGAYVMDWTADYQNFIGLFARVATQFRQFHPDRDTFRLDFEYKKDTRMGLVVKQVREVPVASTNGLMTAFLIDEPTTYSVTQAGMDALATHRLKSLWTLHTANLRLDETNLAHGIYSTGTMEYLEDGALKRFGGPLNSWPMASNSPSGSMNYWTTGSGASQRDWRLQTTLTTTVSGSQPPLFTQQDFRHTLSVTYATPRPVLGFSQGKLIPATTTNESVYLQVRPGPETRAVGQVRTFVRTNLVTIQTSFYWAAPPQGLMAITAPLLRFVETRISGLTSSPLVLTNYYSQTYTSYSHNYFEQFLFEPRLEPGLSAAALAELEAANIQLLYVRAENGRCRAIYVLGWDQRFREL